MKSPVNREDRAELTAITIFFTFYTAIFQLVFTAFGLEEMDVSCFMHIHVVGKDTNRVSICVQTWNYCLYLAALDFVMSRTIKNWTYIVSVIPTVVEFQHWKGMAWHRSRLLHTMDVYKRALNKGSNQVCCTRSNWKSTWRTFVFSTSMAVFGDAILSILLRRLATEKEVIEIWFYANLAHIIMTGYDREPEKQASMADAHYSFCHLVQF